MNTHELAHKLLASPAAELSVSIDISTGDSDCYSRAFGDHLFEVVANQATGETTLLFEGYVNGDTGEANVNADVKSTKHVNTSD